MDARLQTAIAIRGLATVANRPAGAEDTRAGTTQGGRNLCDQICIYLKKGPTTLFQNHGVKRTNDPIPEPWCKKNQRPYSRTMLIKEPTTLFQNHGVSDTSKINLNGQIWTPAHDTKAFQRLRDNQYHVIKLCLVTSGSETERGIIIFNGLLF